jgi:multisubunit Na+/H+ antiporter MnhG subunit
MKILKTVIFTVAIICFAAIGVWLFPKGFYGIGKESGFATVIGAGFLGFSITTYNYFKQNFPADKGIMQKVSNGALIALLVSLVLSFIFHHIVKT